AAPDALTAGFVVELLLGATARAPVGAQSSAAARRDVFGGRPAGLAGLTGACPLLVDGARRDLLGHVLGPAVVPAPLLDVLVLTLTLPVPSSLRHDSSFLPKRIYPRRVPRSPVGREYLAGVGRRSVEDLVTAARERLDRVDPAGLAGEQEAGALVVDIR